MLEEVVQDVGSVLITEDLYDLGGLVEGFERTVRHVKKRS